MNHDGKAITSHPTIMVTSVAKYNPGSDHCLSPSGDGALP